MTERLSRYFVAFAYKRLSAVEVDTKRSNQHEFNGVATLKTIFGIERRQMPARFVYLAEEDDHSATAAGSITWYDARKRHPSRSEHRLYFPTTDVSERAAEGDLLIVAKRPGGDVLLVICARNSSAERQISWFFGVSELIEGTFRAEAVQGDRDTEFKFSHQYVLDQLGIESDATDEDLLEEMLTRFGRTFPRTVEFSAYARSRAGELAAIEEPDATLTRLMQFEERLFRTLERHIVGARLKDGFGTDVDKFVEFSLTVHNRRKSRVGYALEHHVQYVLEQHRLTFSRGRVTEHQARPDFVFPDITRYRDPNFPPERLTVLGLKSTCKDRWRQVLSEAARVHTKHLLTLEPGISEAQTAEMQGNFLQLVVPAAIHDTYTQAQQRWLLTVGDFIKEVRVRQDEHQ